MPAATDVTSPGCHLAVHTWLYTHMVDQGLECRGMWGSVYGLRAGCVALHPAARDIQLCKI